MMTWHMRFMLYCVRHGLNEASPNLGCLPEVLRSRQGSGDNMSKRPFHRFKWESNTRAVRAAMWWSQLESQRRRVLLCTNVVSVDARGLGPGG